MKKMLLATLCMLAVACMHSQNTAVSVTGSFSHPTGIVQTENEFFSTNVKIVFTTKTSKSFFFDFNGNAPTVSFGIGGGYALRVQRNNRSLAAGLGGRAETVTDTKESGQNTKFSLAGISFLQFEMDTYKKVFRRIAAQFSADYSTAKHADLPRWRYSGFLAITPFQERLGIGVAVQHNTNVMPFAEFNLCPAYSPFAIKVFAARSNAWALIGMRFSYF